MTSGNADAERAKRRSTFLALAVAALGYFVDVYDLIVFSVVRVPSLKSLGFDGKDLLEIGVMLLNCQLVGLLVGGIFWGVLGDKRGRVSVLFGSILLYSVANLLNGAVQSVEMYALLRFIAGVGLAGELGAGITLVSEILSREKRGYGTTIVATVGVAGALLAAVVGKSLDWRTAYYVGGVMGLLLLVLRIAVHESGMFKNVAAREVRRGDLATLVGTRERFARYLCCIVIGLPVWFVVGILITFSPEIGKALGMPVPPDAGSAVFYCYVGLVVGDLASGLLSQLLRSRKRAIAVFIMLGLLSSVYFLTSHGATLTEFNWMCVFVGFAVGYWAVFVTTAAEQFGTNLRATVTTTVPNFVRGSATLMTLSFKSLQSVMSPIESAFVVGGASFLLAFLALVKLRETFGRDLDFVEE